MLKYTLFLHIDLLPSSLNKKLTKHWRARHRENKSWDLLIECACQDQKRPRKPLERAKISIVRYSHRMLDFDGLVGSMKPVVDALVSAKIIKDDSWNVTGRWDVNQKFRFKSEGPLLEIMVQSLPEKPLLT